MHRSFNSATEYIPFGVKYSAKYKVDEIKQGYAFVISRCQIFFLLNAKTNKHYMSLASTYGPFLLYHTYKVKYNNIY